MPCLENDPVAKSYFIPSVSFFNLLLSLDVLLALLLACTQATLMQHNMPDTLKVSTGIHIWNENFKPPQCTSDSTENCKGAVA